MGCKHCNNRINMTTNGLCQPCELRLVQYRKLVTHRAICAHCSGLFSLSCAHCEHTGLDPVPHVELIND